MYTSNMTLICFLYNGSLILPACLHNEAQYIKTIVPLLWKSKKIVFKLEDVHVHVNLYQMAVHNHEKLRFIFYTLLLLYD